MTTKTEKDLRPIYDGDGLVYNCGFSADSQYAKKLKEENPDIDPEVLALALADEDYTSHALHNVKVKMEYAIERFNPDYKLYIQDENKTFRYDVATIQPYKGNRKDAKRPKYYSEIREYMIDTWKAIVVNHIETDDAIGIEQYKNTDKSTVLITQDKDLLTIPGWHFDPVKDSLFYQSAKDADNFFFWQMLVGDTADHIPGINRIGKKRADDILLACDHDTDLIREKVKELYQKQYGTGWEAAYTEVGTLLYILRKEDQLEKGCPLL